MIEVPARNAAETFECLALPTCLKCKGGLLLLHGKFMSLTVAQRHGLVLCTRSVVQSWHRTSKPKVQQPLLLATKQTAHAKWHPESLIDAGL